MFSVLFYAFFKRHSLMFRYSLLRQFLNLQTGIDTGPLFDLFNFPIYIRNFEIQLGCVHLWSSVSEPQWGRALIRGQPSGQGFVKFKVNFSCPLQATPVGHSHDLL